MSQRDSGYERKERDLYETPEWVTEALRPHLPSGLRGVWEPACGSGKMARVIQGWGGLSVHWSDIANGHNFFDVPSLVRVQIGAIPITAIVTNPPYETAREFIEHALALTMDRHGLVAMLLRTDYDHAKTRAHLFSECKAFAKKLVLTKRIKWFEDSKGQPSFNHAWFIWDWKHQGPPTLAYGP